MKAHYRCRPLLRRAVVFLSALSLAASLISYIFYSFSVFVSEESRQEVGTVLLTRRTQESESTEGTTEGPWGAVLYETTPLPQYAKIPLLSLGCLYLFLAIAIVCDDCFVPALEDLSLRLGLSDDVAGATLMAAGGSAPELFTSLVATFQRDSGEGIAVSTVMGSAVFNVLFVIGVCCFVVPRNVDLRLRPYPLLRDCTFYGLGLGAFAAFAGGISPGLIEPWEAAVMFCLYILYVLFMAYWTEKVEGLFERTFAPSTKIISTTVQYHTDSEETITLDEELTETHDVEKESAVEKRTDGKSKYIELCAMPQTRHAGTVINGTEASHANGKSIPIERESLIYEDELAKCKDDKSIQVKQLVDEAGLGGESSDDYDDADDEPFLKRLTCPSPGSTCFDYLSYFVQLPLVVLLGFTIPDIRIEANTSNPSACRAVGAFIMSIVWIGIFTYALVLFAEIMGSNLGIPNALMGLTVLATGASAPDMLSSVAVARKGKGDMAVSSTIGSNIFDLLLGLPIPWLLSFAMPGYPMVANIGTDGMVISILVLLGMLFFTILVMKCLQWKMGARLGVSMFLMYIVFISQATYREFQVDPLK